MPARGARRQRLCPVDCGRAAGGDRVRTGAGLTPACGKRRLSRRGCCPWRPPADGWRADTRPREAPAEPPRPCRRGGRRAAGCDRERPGGGPTLASRTGLRHWAAVGAGGGGLHRHGVLAVTSRTGKPAVSTGLSMPQARAGRVGQAAEVVPVLQPSRCLSSKLEQTTSASRCDRSPPVGGRGLPLGVGRAFSGGGSYPARAGQHPLSLCLCDWFFILLWSQGACGGPCRAFFPPITPHSPTVRVAGLLPTPLPPYPRHLYSAGGPPSPRAPIDTSWRC